MTPEVEALNAHVETGTDWMALRHELAARHAVAQNQAEHVEILEDFHRLVAAGPNAFHADVWPEIETVTRSEYRLFLTREAMEGSELMNPALLAYIVAREIKAGRLSQSDSFAEYAATGETLGDIGGAEVMLRRHGDWIFYGAAGVAVITWLFGPPGLSPSPLWLIPVGLLTGWIINERERKAVHERTVAQRVERGYPAALS